MKTDVFNTDDANANINILKEGEHDEEIIQQDRFKNSIRNEIVTNPTDPECSIVTRRSPRTRRIHADV